MSDVRVPVRVRGSVDADIDGQRIILSPRDFSYLGTKGTGTIIWDLIDGARTVDEIVSRLELQFEATDGRIRSETEGFLLSLAEAGLIAKLQGTGS